MATLLLLCPIGIPLLGALVYRLAGWTRATTWVAAASAVLVLSAVSGLAVAVSSGGPLTVGGVLRADALSAYLLVVVGCVAVVATVATPSYLSAERAAGRLDDRGCAHHSVLVQLFLAVMAGAVLAANLGLLWVAIEATTIVTAFLVGQGRTRAAVEAAWKYVVISSTGIALALLGTFLLNYADQHTSSPAGLDWTGLIVAAPQLDPEVTRIAVALLIIGFGTKAGLAPLHAWLPDAYSQAPTPVAALMSGVLSSVAFYAVLRIKVIADAALGPDFARALLLVVALASLVLAASLMLGQRDYHRMLAYSSIENMGLLALGAAIGTPLAIGAVLLHILGHGLVKSSLFLGAGRILRLTGSSRIDRVCGLAARAPVLAGCFGVGVLALIGFPPFLLFASEFGIARAGFAAGLGGVTVAALLLVLVIAGSLLVHVSRMLLGAPAVPEQSVIEHAATEQLVTEHAVMEQLVTPTAGSPAPAVLRYGAATAVAEPITLTGTRPFRAGADIWAMAGALATCAVLGIWIGPLGTLLQQASTVVTGTP